MSDDLTDDEKIACGKKLLQDHEGASIESVTAIYEYNTPPKPDGSNKSRQAWLNLNDVAGSKDINQALLEMKWKIFSAIVGNSSVSNMRVSQVQDISLEAAEAVLGCEWQDD